MKGHQKLWLGVLLLVLIWSFIHTDYKAIYSGKLTSIYDLITTILIALVILTISSYIIIVQLVGIIILCGRTPHYFTKNREITYKTIYKMKPEEIYTRICIPILIIKLIKYINIWADKKL
jgi:hypothetical protein